jgi:hypothetical protein
MSMPLIQDRRGGLMGLIVGGILLFVVLYGIVHLTNVHYAKLAAAEKPAAAAPAP